MKNKTELIPALRAHMGDWIYYVTLLRMEQIADRISIAEKIHSSNALKEMIQRQITDRSKQIADYLVKQPQRFFNALIVGVYGGSPNWYELEVRSNRLFNAEALPRELDGILGFLRLDGTENLFAMDGQHRVEGIRQALRKNSKLKQEEVCVIFVSHRNDPAGMERTRRLFTTLNRYAKPVSKSEIVALDEDDVIAIITRELVENHQLFQEKISISKTKAISVRDNRSFTSIITLYEVLEILFGNKGRAWVKFKRHRPDDDVISQFYAKSACFWDTMIEYFPPLKKVQVSHPDENISGRYRNREGGHLLFRPIGLLIIAYVVRQAKDLGLSEREAIKRISKISMKLTDEPWVGLLWDQTNRRMTIETTRQKVAKHLLFYLIGGNLSEIKTSLEDLQQEYAGLLNRNKSELVFPQHFLPFP